MTTRTIAHPQIVSRDEWLIARKALRHQGFRVPLRFGGLTLSILRGERS